MTHSDTTTVARSGGFALVIALSLMAFVLLLLLSITTFVQVETASAATGKIQQEARANALTSISVALGELQKHAGKDQRVTAHAELFYDDDNRDLSKQDYVAVFSADPNAALPDAPLKWLVSQQNETSDLAAINLVDPVRLRRAKDGQNDPADVMGDRIPVGDSQAPSGHIAYYVDDEGLKAKVTVGAPDVDPAETELRFGRTVVPVPNALKQVWADDTITSEIVGKIGNLEALELLSPAPNFDLNEFSRDYTVSSMGVLCDVKNGGLKKDLTIAFEEDVTFDREFPTSDNLLLTEERKASVNFPNGYANWSILKDYYNLYQRVQSNGGMNEYSTLTSLPQSEQLITSAGISGSDNIHDYGPHEFPHRYHTISPVVSILSRFQVTYWVEYLGGPSDYIPRLHLRPVLGLYNPYNVSLAVYRPNWVQRNISKTSLEVDGRSPKSLDLRASSATNYQFDGSAIVLEPGEIRYLSYADPAPLDVNSARELTDDLASIANASRYLDLNDSAVNITGYTAGDSGIDIAIKHSFYLHRYDQSTASTIGIKQRLYQYINFDSIVGTSTNNGVGKEIDAGIFQFSDLTLTSEEKTLGIWLRTSREDYHQIRPLVDSNVRFTLGDGRWDQIPDMEALAPYSVSEQDPVSGEDTRGELSESMFVTDPVDGHGIWGGSIDDPSAGSSDVVLFDIPRQPLVSLGQLQHANLGRFSYEPTYIIGNSYANIRFPMDDWRGTLNDTMSLEDGLTGSFDLYDVSYLVNESLWDSYFLSTVPAAITSTDVEAFREGSYSFPNARFKYLNPEGVTGVDEATIRDPAAGAAFDTNAAIMMVDGAFNVNSTSVDAWKAVLSSLSDQEIPTYNVASGDFDSWQDESEIHFSKFSAPLGDGFDSDSPSDDFWNGYRTLSEDQVTNLAVAIVEQVKLRGPFNSMAEFVNRALEDGPLGQSGVLQSALDDPNAGVNNVTLDDNYTRVVSSDDSDVDDRLSGSQAAGFPGYLTQGDVLQALGPILTPRSDTFVIRGYGDVTDPVTGKTQGAAWCEAVVQRVPTPVGLSSITGLSDLRAEDPDFGRQFKVLHFRWLTEDEI